MHKEIIWYSLEENILAKYLNNQIKRQNYREVNVVLIFEKATQDMFTFANVTMRLPRSHLFALSVIQCVLSSNQRNYF